MINVRQITKKKDFKKFVKFPDKLYKDCENFVPPFEQDELDLTNKKKRSGGDFGKINLYWVQRTEAQWQRSKGI